MKQFIYTKDEISLIKNLIEQTPHSVWWNYESFMFEYNNSYITLQIVSELAETQNKSDEAIITNIERHDEKFMPTEHCVLICEGLPFSDVSIMRTLLYFTDYKKVSFIERQAKKAKLRLKRLLKLNINPLEIVLSDVTGGCQELCINPQTANAPELNTKYCNLIDTGILLKTDLGYIPAYTVKNGYGFRLNDDKFFFELQDLEDDFEYNEIIKLGQHESR